MTYHLSRTSLTENGLFSRPNSERADVAETVPHCRAVRLSDKAQPPRGRGNCQAQLLNMFPLFFNVFSETGSNNVHNRGFAILFAVLVSGILHTIGLGIFSITYKELLLSSSDRESQVAFYAADTGTECALYWDIQHPDTPYSVFGLVLSPATTSPPDESSPILCGNQDVILNGYWSPGGMAAPIETTFRIENIGGTSACADVTVTKDYDSGEGKRTTQIDSRGFNTCDTNASRRAERGLRVEYSI